jgi:cryptochrome
LQGQKKAGVRITGDGKSDKLGVYPKPMFDFAERRAICLDGMKAYAVGLYGNDPRVVDSTWRTLFDDGAESPTEGETFTDAMGGAGVRNDDALDERPATPTRESREENRTRDG